MSKAANPIPEGFHTVTPQLVIRGAADAIEFYKRALGAQERSRMNGPDGKVMHAELKIGDSIVFVADEMPTPSNAKAPQSIGGSTTILHLYVPDVDSTFQKAIQAGGRETMPVADQFWGDRYGAFVDPYGHSWGIGTRKEDLSHQETAERAKKFFAAHAQQRKTA